MWNSFSSSLWNSAIRISWIKKHIFVLIITMLIYIINRLILKNLEIPYIDYLLKNHLGDYIGGIVFCIYLNLIFFIGKRKPINKFGVIIIIMLLVSVLWEYFFPLFLKYSTSDPLDIIAYMLGTITYYLLFYKQNNIIVKEG